MLAVAIITGKLTANLRQRANELTAEAARSQALYEMARDLTGALTTTQISEITQSFLRRGLQAEAIILLDGALVAKNRPSISASGISPHWHERGETLECTQLVDSGYAAIYLAAESPDAGHGEKSPLPRSTETPSVHAQRDNGWKPWHRWWPSPSSASTTLTSPNAHRSRSFPNGCAARSCRHCRTTATPLTALVGWPTRWLPAARC